MELQTARHSSQMRTLRSEGEGMRRSTTSSALWQKEQRSVSALADRIYPLEAGCGIEHQTAAYGFSVAQGSRRKTGTWRAHPLGRKLRVLAHRGGATEQSVTWPDNAGSTEMAPKRPGRRLGGSGTTGRCQRAS